MKLSCALSMSVSCLVLTAGNVFAYSFSGTGPSLPLHSTSITSTTHTSTPGRFLQPDVLYTQIRKSAPPRVVAESKLLVDRDLNALLGNVPNDSISDEQTKKTRGVAESGLLVDGNFQNQSSTVILGLDPRIQVKQGFLCHLDTPIKFDDDNSAGIPRQARDDKSFLAAGTMPSNAFKSLSTHSQLAPAGAPRLEQRASGQYPSAANRWLTASVCFITDTGACSGIGGAGGEEYPNGGGPDWDNDSGQRCVNEGYGIKDCAPPASAGKTCPYDSSYTDSCICPAEYDKTCDVIPPRDPSDSCQGKYKECCNTCEGFDYTSIPDGYDEEERCDSCTGLKFKIKKHECDPNQYTTCGALGEASGAGKCRSGEEIYYNECKCPLNYEWNKASQQCVCSTSFRYNCQGTGYAGGEGQECDNKYARCRCEPGYSWDEKTGACVCLGVDWCALNQNCEALGYKQQSCEKWSVKCPFDSSYVYCTDCPTSFDKTCAGTGEISQGLACDGKYKSCGCESGYQYTCSGTGYSGGFGTSCGDKYTACTCATGYEWKNGKCEKITNGLVGDLYYCNGTVVGIKVPGQNFVIAMNESRKGWSSANSYCTSYSFCGTSYGRLPTDDELLAIYNNITYLQDQLQKNGGQQFTNKDYWSSSSYGGDYYYAVNPVSGSYTYYWSGNGEYVRPVLAF